MNTEQTSKNIFMYPPSSAIKKIKAEEPKPRKVSTANYK